MAKSSLASAKFPKFPKEVKDKDVQKAIEQARKDFEAFAAAARALSGPQKKAKASMWAAEVKLGDYLVDVCKDPKEISAGEAFDAQYMDLYRIVAKF